MTDAVTFTATVRNPAGSKKEFLAVKMGRITSQSLAPFIDSDIEVTIRPLLCPVCQHPLRGGKCPDHGKQPLGKVDQSGEVQS